MLAIAFAVAPATAAADCGGEEGDNLRLGRHVFRAYAIDTAGNRDSSPVVYRFAVRRLIVRSSRSHHRRGSNR